MSDDKIVIEPDEEDIIWDRGEGVRKKTFHILTFSLGRENYCVSLNQMKEVIRPLSITRVPNSPDFIVGVINLRGEIVTVLDIRHFFGLSDVEKAKDARIMITTITGSCVGVMIDKMGAIIEIEEEVIQPPLATFNGKLAEYTKGEVQLGSDILVLLDLKKVLNNEVISNLRKGAS